MSDMRTPFEDAGLAPANDPHARKSAGGYAGPEFTGRDSASKILAEIHRARLRIFKETLMGITLVALGGVMGMQWALAFATGTITLGAFAATVGFIVFASIAAVLLKWNILISAQILAGLLIAVPFWGTFLPIWILVFWLVAVATLVIAGLATMMRAQSVISFNLSVLSGGIGILALGFALILTAIFYGTKIPGDKVLLSQDGMVKIFTIGQGAVATVIPGFTPEMSIDEYLNAIMANEEERLTEILRQDPRYAALSPAGRDQLRAEALSSARQAALEGLSRMVNQPINPGQKFVSFLYQYLNQWVFGLSPEAQNALMKAWFLLLFFTIWSLGMLLRPIIAIAAWLLLQVFLAVRVIEVNRATIERKYLAFR